MIKDCSRCVNYGVSMGEEPCKSCEQYSNFIFNEDAVNHPLHYNTGSIEVIDYIIDKLKNPVDYCVGNTLKYTSRFRHKGTPLQDLQKAQWYLNKAIALMEEMEGEQ